MRLVVRCESLYEGGSALAAQGPLSPHVHVHLIIQCISTFAAVRCAATSGLELCTDCSQFSVHVPYVSVYAANPFLAYWMYCSASDFCRTWCTCSRCCGCVHVKKQLERCSQQHVPLQR
jgi:hypothetical protein